MVTLLVVLFAALWLGAGYLAARMLIVDFEVRFGEGTGPSDIAVPLILMGPLGLLVSFISADSGATFKGYLGKEPVPDTNEVFYIDKRRTPFQAFLVKGVVGLPSYDENTQRYIQKYPYSWALDKRTR